MVKEVTSGRSKRLEITPFNQAVDMICSAVDLWKLLKHTEMCSKNSMLWGFPTWMYPITSLAMAPSPLNLSSLVVVFARGKSARQCSSIMFWLSSAMRVGLQNDQRSDLKGSLKPTVLFARFCSTQLNAIGSMFSSGCTLHACTEPK